MFSNLLYAETLSFFAEKKVRSCCRAKAPHILSAKTITVDIIRVDFIGTRRLYNEFSVNPIALRTAKTL